MHPIEAFRASRRGPLLQVVKSVVATTIAWLVAAWLIQGPPPVFAAIAALLVVQPSIDQSFAKAIERSIGVIVGVVVATLVQLLLGDASWVVLVAIAAAMLVAWALSFTAGTANQLAISAMLVLALGSDSPHYAFDRVLETLVGAVIGCIVNVAIVPPVALSPARRAMDELCAGLASCLDRLADGLEQPVPAGVRSAALREARALRPALDATHTALDEARASLTLNPRARRHRLEIAALDALLERCTSAVTQVIGMTRAYVDHYDASIVDEPIVADIVVQLRRAAHDVRLLQRRASAVADPEAPVTTTLPALTTPLVVAQPARRHWLLIGSLLEDLRRMHETLSVEAER